MFWMKVVGSRFVSIVAELPKIPVLALMLTGTVKLRHDLADAEPANTAAERRVKACMLSFEMLQKTAAKVDHKHDRTGTTERGYGSRAL